MAKHVQPSYFPISFLDTNNPHCIGHRIPEPLVPEIMDAMHTVCFISSLCLATEQHCTLPQKGGGKWEGLSI